MMNDNIFADPFSSDQNDTEFSSTPGWSSDNADFGFSEDFNAGRACYTSLDSN